MTHTFEPDALVVNMIASDRMTQGRCYRVIGSYDGHSGAGAQEWTRVADDTGQVVGFDPQRFIPAGAQRGEPLAAILSTAFRMHRRLKTMRQGLGNGDLTQALRTKLDDQIEDIESIIAAASSAPVENQITFQDVSGGAAARGLFMEVIVGVDGVEVGRMMIERQRDFWSFAIDGGAPQDLETGDWATAIARVKDAVRAAAAAEHFHTDESLGFWAGHRQRLRSKEAAHG